MADGLADSPQIFSESALRDSTTVAQGGHLQHHVVLSAECVVAVTWLDIFPALQCAGPHY